MFYETSKNEKIIKEQITLKQMYEPTFVNNTVYSVNNDYDVFPYTRWYKGIASSDKPHVADREAGWIPKKIVKKVKPAKPEESKMCFQAPCSVVYPCYAQDNLYISINKGCVPYHQ